MMGVAAAQCDKDRTNACSVGFVAACPAAVARVDATVEHGATREASQSRSCHNGNVTPIRYTTLFIRRNPQVLN
jgi:hypothetical protein